MPKTMIENEPDPPSAPFYRALLRGASKHESTLSLAVPEVYVGQIIGRGGTTIRGIEKSTGTRIFIDGRRVYEQQRRRKRRRQERRTMGSEETDQESRSGAREWNEHDIAHHTAERSNIARLEDARRRIRHGVEHQESREQIISSQRYNVRTAATEALYSKGLVIYMYCGTIVTEDGKEKNDFEPFRPINTSPLYLCDNKFRTETLAALLADKFGFIVMDGNGALFGVLSGNSRDVLHKFTVDLPKKHGRGGQSALRFARLRMEKGHNYVRKVAETVTQLFITNDKPNVTGLVLAGSADFKTELSQSDLFDGRLQYKILKVVDIAYGGENGFNQAIELASDVLANVKFIQDRNSFNYYILLLLDVLLCFSYE
ncbi:eukaryotic peptide chain release factor subunit 1-like isoform X2 [Oscarella lobularis]|uniref:eukaryotic peptide chain release factor subunit 1-like isoform X2 n=1 Tax=Oscarella lobularis TaxID=121494 RepID=UPI0033132091